MEYLQIIEQLVNSMGFPVLMVLYFIWDKQQTMKPLIDAVNNNTNTIDKLMEIIKMVEKEGYFEHE